MYGEEYMTRVEHPHQVMIEKSKPFRMRFPEHQAEFFKLLSTLLYYLVSGYSNVGYLAADEWNPYYKILYGIQVHQDLIRTNPQKPRMYECVVVDSYHADPAILYAEGDLDMESDAEDEEIEELNPRQAHSETSSTRATDGFSEGSWDSRGGSPMEVINE